MDDAEQGGVQAPPAENGLAGLFANGAVPQTPGHWREIPAVVLMVVLCDLAIFRGEGYAGVAAVLLLAPLLLAFGAPRPSRGFSVWLVGLMLVALAGRLVWLGSPLGATTGLVLLVAFAAALAGLRPYVLESIVFGSQAVLTGYLSVLYHRRTIERFGQVLPRGRAINVLLPAITLVAFGVLFVLANPNLLTYFGQGIEAALTTFRQWMIDYAPTPLEIAFWIAVVWCTLGLLRPAISRKLVEVAGDEFRPPLAQVVEPSPLYAAYRNTLATVIVLFAVYLGFEFATLWFTEFPEGFYYSGYAHQGAAWLTVALALATFVLSLVFRGTLLRDERLPLLRRLAWVWSLENLLLAVAVYHRMTIYIGFNGMTRMRTVALFGISVVLVGFVLVVWKIFQNRSFVWLLRRHLWALALTVYLFCLTPVDTLVVRYNVQRIVGGDPAPSCQITEHPISAEGITLLLPLLDCDDAIIREGVAAMLAARLDDAEQQAVERAESGWTAYQIAEQRALDQLRAHAARWQPYADAELRDTCYAEFRRYAYQWY